MYRESIRGVLVKGFRERARRFVRQADRAPSVYYKAAASVGEMIDESQPGQNLPKSTGQVLKRLGWFGRLRLFWIVFAFALLVYTQFQFWKQPSQGDRANWDYFAQVVSRG